MVNITKQPCAAQAKPWILVATILGSSMVFISGAWITVAYRLSRWDWGPRWCRAGVAGLALIIIRAHFCRGFVG